ncbi:hypothetical protein SALBM311S_01776 [Streptomyces alboniger]
MLETSARLLRLLSLLQAHREWSGADLADRLGVTARTVRRDVDRLRELGYPVNASPGTGGGYQLGAGAELPPLLLDDDEAVAVAVGLRTAAGQGIDGIGETSVRALAKLEQVLPGRLRRRVSALNAFTVPMLRGPAPSTVDPAVLTELANLCRDAELLRFEYRDHGGTPSRRTAEAARHRYPRAAAMMLASTRAPTGGVRGVLCRDRVFAMRCRFPWTRSESVRGKEPGRVFRNFPSGFSRGWCDTQELFSNPSGRRTKPLVRVTELGRNDVVVL